MIENEIIRGDYMPIDDLRFLKDIISIEDEVQKIQDDIDKVDKEKERIRQRRILIGIK